MPSQKFETRRSVSRRTVLRGAAGAGSIGAALSVAAPVAAEGDNEPDYGGWFENVSNYEKTVDMTGQQEVTITVGAEGNNGHFAFDPPAVRIDPGTTVVWEWSGNGGVHNVAAEDGSFTSELSGEAGFTFSQTIEKMGILKYACQPHRTMGMRGALAVGVSEASGATSPDTSLGDMLAVGGGLGLAGVLLAIFALGMRSNSRKPTRKFNR